jgi:ligand-binding SRPBCC domain-containing protein
MQKIERRSNISVIESQIYAFYTSKDIHNLLTPTFRSIKSLELEIHWIKRRLASSEDKTKVKFQSLNGIWRMTIRMRTISKRATVVCFHARESDH